MLALRTATVCSAQKGAEGRAAARARVSSGVAAKKDSRRDVLLLAGVMAGSALFGAKGADAVECSIRVPCMIMAPDGKPRYELPGIQYDPAKEAERRYKEKMQAKIAAEASQKPAATPAPAAE